MHLYCNWSRWHWTLQLLVSCTWNSCIFVCHCQLKCMEAILFFSMAHWHGVTTTERERMVIISSLSGFSSYYNSLWRMLSSTLVRNHSRVTGSFLSALRDWAWPIFNLSTLILFPFMFSIIQQQGEVVSNITVISNHSKYYTVPTQFTHKGLNSIT